MKARLAERARRLAAIVPGKLDQATGGYRYLARMLAELRRTGWQIDLHELPGRFPDADRVAARAAALALARIPRRRATVIDGLALPAFAGELRELSRRKRCVALIHHPLALETGLASSLARRLAAVEARLVREVARVIVTSRATASQVAAMGVAHERIMVVAPGTERASLARPRARGRVRLLTVATATPRKGHDVALAALARLGRRGGGLGWRLDCAGSITRDPAWARRLKALARLHRLGARVRFHGAVDMRALRRFHARAQIFVLASHHEGYGMALAEALASGVPVVATRAGAIAAPVPRAASLLVRPGDARSLARALGRLIARRGQRRILAAGARAWRRRLPDWPTAARDFARAIEGLAR